MEEYGRTVTFIWLSCDSRLGDPYTHGKGAGTGRSEVFEVRGTNSQWERLHAWDPYTWEGRRSREKTTRLKVKKGKTAWAVWKLKDAVGTK